MVERLGRVKMQLLEGQELETALSDVMKWIVSMEKLQGKQEALSLRPAKLQKQHLENEVSIHITGFSSFIILILQFYGDDSEDASVPPPQFYFCFISKAVDYSTQISFLCYGNIMIKGLVRV